MSPLFTLRTKKTFLFIASLALGSLQFIHTSHARPSTKSYNTCGDLRQFIKQKGAVVMNTKTSKTYRRFVNSRRFCSRSNYVAYHIAPTRSGTCRLKVCTPHDFQRIGNWR